MQIFGFVICATFVVYINAYPALETDLITQPTPGQEYVFVQSSGTGARPIARKDKVVVDDDQHRFETSHKFPPSLKYLLHDVDDDDCGDKKKTMKKKVEKRDAPAPAPAGAIKLDVQQLLEKYKTELKTSTTEAPKPTTRRRNAAGNRRTKKEARLEPSVTSPKPILTTSASAPKPIVDDDDDDDIPLVASGSEKQRSRIQIKKGPNGQEYEYEYVYYYYDDDDNNATVTNAHDGPSREKLAETTKNRKAETINEIVPSARGRTRGRQLTDDETVNEERLPANTRFPPRSRNLNTTPLPEEETKTTTTTTKGRSRGRSTTEAVPVPAETDNVSDETQGSRGRTRANVRRPSLDLVDNASFNTAGAESAASSPSFPTNLPAGPVRFLGATPNEQEDLPEPPVKSEEDPQVEDASKDDEDVEVDTTTTMSPMDKVALDLYAILQGTQKLSGDESIPTSEESLTDSTNEAEVTTELTTEALIETTTPTSTTTTTTTTTTPAPTTTTTTTTTTPAPAPTGRGRFKGRGRKTTASAISTTEATSQTETKPKSKFSRPSFGNRPRNRATTEASVEKELKEETKTQTHARPTLSRGRFGASRTRPRTTAAPEEKEDDSSSSSSSSSTSAPVSRPSLTRPRATFNLRNRGHTTAAPATTAADAETSEEAAGQEPSSTTVRTRRIQPSTGVRPLRPGPRINLARNRPGSTTTEAPVEDHVTGDEDNQSHEEQEKQEPEEKVEESSAAPVDNSPLAKLRNKQKIQIKPKAAASTSVQVRRINPLIRRRPGQAAETSSETPAPESASSESPTSSDDENQTEESLASSTTTTTTTEEPRGLNKLLAGRRRLATRPLAHS